MKTIEKSPLHRNPLTIQNPKILFAIFIILGMTACSKDPEILAPAQEDDVPEAPVGYADVDEVLWDYFDRFEQEASSRGITIDIRSENISGNISEIQDEHVAGTCNYNYRTPNKVTIDQSFWSRSGDRYREFVVFHELGHCLLYREHRESANDYNICESIMRSGTGNCLDNYNRNTRSAYLDELFDPAFRGDIFTANIDF